MNKLIQDNLNLHQIYHYYCEGLDTFYLEKGYRIYFEDKKYYLNRETLEAHLRLKFDDIIDLIKYLQGGK